MWPTNSRSETGILALRATVVLLLTLTLLSLGYSFLSAGATADDSMDGAVNGTLVATIDGTGPGQIVAYGFDGSVLYRNRTHLLYHDVDPSPTGNRTVMYVASDPASPSNCDGRDCLMNAVERVNLTTGNVTRLHSWYDARRGSTQIHDVDRVNKSVLLVADINFPDRVFMVNTTSDQVLWEWRVAEAYGKESGGAYPSDWTHINDVELLPDGRVMANLRNQDQVVFLDPGNGVQPNWTLGADDNHTIIYEPHNPDYIPRSQGGPAILIADSENNRLVEYQRQNGSWDRTWHWQDTKLQWPRDADRLPSGRTLVADSHGSRLLAITESGKIAWSKDFPDGGYDVEVLGTGDESSGQSAASLGLTSRWPGGNTFTYSLVSLVPPLALHGLLYTLPTWTTAFDATLILLTLIATALWTVAEVGIRLQSRIGA